MCVIKSFSRLITHLTSLRSKPTVAVVCPYDEGTCAALLRALSHDIIRVVLVGQPQRIDATGIRQMYPDKVEVLAADDAADAATKAVELVRRHSADILMKGLIGTDQLLHAVLNKPPAYSLPAASSLIFPPPSYPGLTGCCSSRMWQ